MEKFRTAINEKWLDKNGVLRMKVIEGAFIDLPSLIEDSKINEVITRGKKALVLYDATAYFIITPEAEDYLRSGVLNNSRIATAVVTNKLGVRLLVNFMNKVRKSGSPLKMFKHEMEALEWLSAFKKQPVEIKSI